MLRIAYIPSRNWRTITLEALEGVLEYSQQHGPWKVYTGISENLNFLGRMPQDWSTWDGDGAIAEVNSAEQEERLSHLRCPIVNTVSWGSFHSEIPSVVGDLREQGRLAALHLVDLGMRRVVFCSRDDNKVFTRPRYEGFADELKRHGIADVPWMKITDIRLPSDSPDFIAWLQNVDKHIALFCDRDTVANWVLCRCRELGISVPDEVAVLGVDNSDFICRFAIPPLSSVDQDYVRIGYLAARLLHQAILGKEIPARTLVTPGNVIARESTDLTMQTDPIVVEALQILQASAFGPFDVNQLVEQLPLSRRMLEIRFRKATGRTPNQELTRLRIGRIKSLLGETSMPVRDIAKTCGFTNESHMTALFRKHVGIPPTLYRNSRRNV